MIEDEDILARLREWVPEKWGRQTQVARELGIDPARVAEMRDGTRQIQPGERNKLIRLLGMQQEQPASGWVPSLQSVELMLAGAMSALPGDRVDGDALRIVATGIHTLLTRLAADPSIEDKEDALRWMVLAVLGTDPCAPAQPSRST